MKERQSIQFRFDFKAMLVAFRFARRFRKHPEDLESLLELAREKGTTESDIATFRGFFVATRTVGTDKEASFRADRYLVAGVGAIDLVLLPTILPLGVTDGVLFLALLSLSISLVLAGTSLFISYIKDDLGIVTYGCLHSNLTFMAELLGVTAIAATLWHVSTVIAWIFMGLAVTTTFCSLMYWWFARTAIEFVRKQELRDAGADARPDAASERE